MMFWQALKYLRTAEFKPYVIYVKPPTLAVLKETREAAHARSTFDENNSRGFTVSAQSIFFNAIAREMYQSILHGIVFEY